MRAEFLFTSLADVCVAFQSYLTDLIERENLRSQIRKERDQLLMMDDRMLADIGKTRQQAFEEARRLDSDYGRKRIMLK